MTTVVKVIGDNIHGQFGTTIPYLPPNLVDGGINKLSTNINQIIFGSQYAIYCEEGYKNIWTAGYNSFGQCATDTFKDGFHLLTFFKNKGINIKKICTNVNAYNVFWITESGLVYGNGTNTEYQLGIGNNDDDESVPILIDGLKDVIDIQCNSSYSIALCSNSRIIFIIVSYWTKMASSKMMIPRDIINVIIKYYNVNRVLSTGWSRLGGHGGSEYVETWTEIKQLKHKTITKIRIGRGHSYFLDLEGIVWVSGRNDKGQLGLGHYQWAVKKITSIHYFVEKNIKIKEIECGSDHVIMLDRDNCVWAFGQNVNQPKEIIMFRDCTVEEIKSGLNHVYVKCNGDKHYFWGNNKYNQCMSESENCVVTPYLLSLKERGMEIENIFLGWNCTAFVVFM